MKRTFIVLILLIGCICSCNAPMEDAVPVPSLPTEITFSRTTLNEESLPEGARALFNATGAIQMDNLVLTYQDGKWEGDNLPRWDDDETSATLTVIHPTYEDATYTTANLYENTLLTDVLIAKDTLTENKDIQLRFNHLFSKFTIQACSSIQSTLEELQLTVPVTIDQIDPKNGIITSRTEDYTHVLTANESGSYSFILPPMTDASLTLTTIADGKTYINPLPAKTYQSGVEYTCKLRKKGGIYNVQDLIDFSNLINGKSVSGRTLEDFYNVIDGDTIIFLEEDLTLTADSSKQILPIGYHNTHGFRHTFDGQGHTISGLVVPDKSTNSNVNNAYSGLFGYITEDGIVRNLTISGASNVKDATADGIGVLAAQNYGLIIDCAILTSTLTIENTSGNIHQFGFICGSSYGIITNCHVKNCTLTADNNCMAGFIAGCASGKLLNCRSFNNTYKYDDVSSLYAGGIVGSSRENSSLSIVNCYSYTMASKDRNHFGSIIGFPRKGLVRNAFYNTGNAYYREPTNTEFINTDRATLDEGFIYNDTLITDHFHNWIDTKGKANYPDIVFKRWTIPDGGYPKFDE